jgi:putative transcriptional regulator
MKNDATFLTNHFLIAMPSLADPYFSQSVTYICEHNEKGAIGIVINHPLELNLVDVFKQMDIKSDNPGASEFPILCGGPMHPERGFVLHTPGGNWRSSLEMSSEISVTTSKDILVAIAQNEGPKNVVVSLGYANWTAGQLEKEIRDNLWLVCDANADVLFKLPFAERWRAALHLLGVDPHQLSSDAGHA